MKFGRIMLALPVAGALLAACGGGSGMGAGANAVSVQSGQLSQAGNTGSAVGEPAPDGVAVLPFTRMARESSCAGTRNRLFVIDDQQVFWDRAGSCADASYEQTLYGSKPDNVLCRHGDSIAGPMTSCADATQRALFDTIVANLDKSDLGLGSSHKVEAVPFLPQAGTPIAFTSVAASQLSGVTTPLNLVIRDQAAWDKLWAQHSANQVPAPSRPRVDFSRQMLIAVFAGDYHDACFGLSITSIAAGDDKLVVQVNQRGPRMGVMCAMIATNPMQVVAVDRIDADADFVVTKTVDVGFDTLATTSQAPETRAQNVVARDADAYLELWAQFAASGDQPPQVDFDNSMVIGVFAGMQPNSCYATGVGGVMKSDTELRVQVIDQVPPPDVACAQVITSPAQLVVVPRSDLPVTFVTAVQPAKP